MLAQAEKAAVVAAFNSLFSQAADFQLYRITSALDDLEHADPKLVRMLRGHYLFRDIFFAVKEEYAAREAPHVASL